MFLQSCVWISRWSDWLSSYLMGCQVKGIRTCNSFAPCCACVCFCLKAGCHVRPWFRRLLREENPPAALASAVLAISQVARLHGDYYVPLAAANLCKLLRPLLTHREACVRARACNLVGNMCRHSPAFYRPLLDAGLLPLLIAGCGDSDRATRKFACFALGNAGELADVAHK